MEIESGRPENRVSKSSKKTSNEAISHPSDTAVQGGVVRVLGMPQTGLFAGKGSADVFDARGCMPIKIAVLGETGGGSGSTPSGFPRARNTHPEGCGSDRVTAISPTQRLRVEPSGASVHPAPSCKGLPDVDFHLSGRKLIPRLCDGSILEPST